MKNKKEANIWIIRIFVLIVVVVLFFLSVSIYKEFQKKKQVENDIEVLKEQAEKIKQENMTLEERLAYLSSQDYQKIQARDKLDLQDPEENVVVITQDTISLNQSIKEEESKNKDEIKINYKNEDTSNLLKWWNYFFKK